MGFFNFETGERPPIDKSFEEVDAVLTKGYVFAAGFVKDKIVLDIGCAGGYGSDYLYRHGARKVIGIELSTEAADSAKEKFGRDNLEFFAMDATSLNFGDSLFDVVISFQVIEHIIDYKKYLSEVRRVLKDDGFFIVSTPNKNITSPNRKKPVFPFHAKEFYPDELSLLLSKYFREVRILGQKTVNKSYADEETKFIKSWRHKLIWYLSYSDLVTKLAKATPLKVKRFFTRPPNLTLKLEDLSISEDYKGDGYILIGVCKK